MVACRTKKEEFCSMDIGCPTNVRHVAHVTFDRFNGFLGLPVEFEPEVPKRAPSASATVFGVSTESMQCSYDSRGNSVPTILLLMQRRLYAEGGLQAEGIFRINAENSQEEYVRDQLNRGLVPDGIDMHCLAGLIKAWFRELPSGILDPLAPEQVMQCHSEEEYTQLVRRLPPIESALLDWSINLMADVVQEEHHNKMNSRNVAMVFAPNMTQMADPLNALMYAVQVMNFLKTLIERNLRERKDSNIESAPASDANGHHRPLQMCFLEELNQEKEEKEHVFVAENPILESPQCPTEDDLTIDTGADSSQTSLVEAIPDANVSLDGDCSCEVPTQVHLLANNGLGSWVQANTCKNRIFQTRNSNLRKGPQKVIGHPVVPVAGPEKSKGISIGFEIHRQSGLKLGDERDEVSIVGVTDLIKSSQ